MIEQRRDRVEDLQQRLYGYKTLNLLNANGDPSLMSTVLYSHIARQYIPTPKANLVKAEPPIFVPGKYTARGKWMDGWESRRRRTPGHDWCIVALGIRGVVHGVNVCTRFFTGNFPSHCSIDALDATGNLRLGCFTEFQLIENVTGDAVVLVGVPQSVERTAWIVRTWSRQFLMTGLQSECCCNRGKARVERRELHLEAAFLLAVGESLPHT